eukprot:15180729-Alexandrium_andersonii.AAC.1
MKDLQEIVEAVGQQEVDERRNVGRVQDLVAKDCCPGWVGPMLAEIGRDPAACRAMMTFVRDARWVRTQEKYGWNVEAEEFS